MAQGAPHRCLQPGCRVLLQRGVRRCEAHAASSARSDWQRRKALGASLYSEAEWRRRRAAFLAAHPHCRACGVDATVVDHIVPHRGDRALFYAESNCQGMCATCHSKKTALYDSGFGR
ncbi:MAG: HNH endonuclease [Thiofilum sp.]|nr:HNH endonuclease [Thiofilum sp.]MBK8455675.1 HNH endonuclease [Thiofilum sp.]